MARRNPSGISPILSARGYGARVLWPKYTPGGGINSGSEIPPRPRNTLQSNQSNLIATYENPFGIYEEEIEPGIVYEPYVSDSALDNPFPRRGKKSALRYNPEAAPAKPRLSAEELASRKTQAVALLKAGKSHADVRKIMGDVPFPLYMAILRSGTTKRAQAAHVPDSPSHFLRMPIDERKDKRKQAISMLKSGTKHEDVRKSLGVGYKTYLGILRTIPNPHQYNGYHEMMSNPSMLRLNPFGY